MKINQQGFVIEVAQLLLDNYLSGNAPFASKTSFEKLAETKYGIHDKHEAKELAEYATLMAARGILTANTDETSRQKYDRLVKLYQIQPNITHRTSWSVIYQQYSTPIPIGYLAGTWCLGGQNGLLQSNYRVFEPSAGNGLMTVAFNQQNVDVNDIDTLRHEILSSQSYYDVTRFDSSDPARMNQYKGLYDYVVTNPPFDKLDINVQYDGLQFTVLDHLMAALALSCMKPEGRAAVIIGGHTEYDDKGRIKAGKNRAFISYLYDRYNVVDIININGDLYRKQGTQFDIRLILIDGVRQSLEPSYPPLVPDKDARVVNTFEQLWDRVMSQTETQSKKTVGVKFIHKGDTIRELETGQKGTIVEIISGRTAMVEFPGNEYRRVHLEKVEKLEHPFQESWEEVELALEAEAVMLLLELNRGKNGLGIDDTRKKVVDAISQIWYIDSDDFNEYEDQVVVSEIKAEKREWTDYSSRPLVSRLSPNEAIELLRKNLSKDEFDSFVIQSRTSEYADWEDHDKERHFKEIIFKFKHHAPKTKAGNKPDEFGVYSTELSDVKKWSLERQGRENHLDIFLLELENDQWVAGFNYNYLVVKAKPLNYIPRFDSAVEALQYIKEKVGNDRATGEFIDSVAEEITREQSANPSKYLKTKAGNEPNEHGVYNVDLDEVEKWLLPKKGSRLNHVEICIVELENGKWISTYSYDYGTGGMSRPLTAKEQFDSREKAILDATITLMTRMDRNDTKGRKFIESIVETETGQSTTKDSESKNMKGQKKPGSMYAAVKVEIDNELVSAWVEQPHAQKPVKYDFPDTTTGKSVILNVFWHKGLYSGEGELKNENWWIATNVESGVAVRNSDAKNKAQAEQELLSYVSEYVGNRGIEDLRLILNKEIARSSKINVVINQEAKPEEKPGKDDQPSVKHAPELKDIYPEIIGKVADPKIDKFARAVLNDLLKEMATYEGHHSRYNQLQWINFVSAEYERLVKAAHHLTHMVAVGDIVNLVERLHIGNNRSRQFITDYYGFEWSKSSPAKNLKSDVEKLVSMHKQPVNEIKAEIPADNDTLELELELEAEAVLVLLLLKDKK